MRCFEPGLPTSENPRDVQLQTPLRYIATDSKLIAEFGECAAYLSLPTQCPENFINAILAADDDKLP